MRILMTGAQRPLGVAAGEHFEADHELRLVAGPEADFERLVKDIDAILHLAAFEQPACTDAPQEQEAD